MRHECNLHILYCTVLQKRKYIATLQRKLISAHNECMEALWLNPEAGISKNYCATKSSSPEVELWFYRWIILFKYWTGRPDLSSSLCPYYANGARPKVSLRWQDLRLYTVHVNRMSKNSASELISMPYWVEKYTAKSDSGGSLYTVQYSRCN